MLHSGETGENAKVFLNRKPPRQAECLPEGTIASSISVEGESKEPVKSWKGEKLNRSFKGAVWLGTVPLPDK